MQLSCLKLNKYFFTRIKVEANAAAGKQSEYESEISSHAECEPHKDDPRKWMVVLTVKVEAEKDKIHPYEIDVQVIGLFTFLKEEDPEKIKKIVHVNAPSLLFGAVREMVANVTARGPYAAVQLPCVAFTDALCEGAQITRPVIKRKVTRAIAKS